MSSEIKKTGPTDMWNQRYAQDDYVYGIQPNEFLKQELSCLQPGKILFPAEGEGRNAVFAGLQGWEVVAFDSSHEAMKKAVKLAQAKKVNLDYRISTMEEVEFEENSFDAIALIYAHTGKRELNHKRMIRFLKPGGTLILEGFSKNQLANNSGGPKDPSFLFTVEELKNDFASLKILTAGEYETELNEGSLHVGKASVVRIVATR